MITIPDDWRMIIPGCYIDKDGDGHLFPTEAIRGLQLRFPKAGFDFARQDFDMIVEQFSKRLDADKPKHRLYVKLTVHRSDSDDTRDVHGGECD